VKTFSSFWVRLLHDSLIEQIAVLMTAVIQIGAWA
jgi:hypothetical protein